MFGGKGGGILSSIFSGIAGARANGGPVSGGSSYLVGERGPELFTPSVSGAIVPNNKMGGGSLTVQPIIATISMSDDGSVSGTVKVMVRQGSEQAVATSRRSLPAWQAEYARTGGLV